MDIRIEDDSAIVLTRKEYEVLKRIAEGMSSEQIAAEMELSYPTVKWYRKQLLTKFSATTSAAVVRKAIEMGIL